MRKYGESKTTRIMMETVLHVTSGSGLRKFQADGFLLDRVYNSQRSSFAAWFTLRNNNALVFKFGSLPAYKKKVRHSVKMSYK